MARDAQMLINFHVQSSVEQENLFEFILKKSSGILKNIKIAMLPFLVNFILWRRSCTTVSPFACVG